jgi:hypothetical protein
MANTLVIETAARIPSLSCIQTYKRICAGRHNTDTSSVNNPGGQEVSDPLGDILVCGAYSAILSISTAVE